MYEILKLIQETDPRLLAKNPCEYPKIEFLQINQGDGSMIIRHADQPYADFHFLPGSENRVLVPTDEGGNAEIVGFKLEFPFPDY